MYIYIHNNMSESSESSTSTQQVKRKGFNWQFIGIEPSHDSHDDLGLWSVEQVSTWLNSLSLNTLADVSTFISSTSSSSYHHASYHLQVYLGSEAGLQLTHCL